MDMKLNVCGAMAQEWGAAQSGRHKSGAGGSLGHAGGCRLESGAAATVGCRLREVATAPIILCHEPTLSQ